LSFNSITEGVNLAAAGSEVAIAFIATLSSAPLPSVFTRLSSDLGQGWGFQKKQFSHLTVDTPQLTVQDTKLHLVWTALTGQNGATGEIFYRRRD
jgi:hypothetical protein